MKIARRKALNADVGMFSISLDTYWNQFPGLREEMNAKSKILKKKLTENHVTVHDFGMIDNARKAYEILPAIKAADLDVLFVDMTTYGTSATFGAIIREMQCPVVLVALQPLVSLNYEKATTFMQLCNDDICAVPEFSGVAIRMGKPVSDLIIGRLEDDATADREITAWCRIAHARHDLRKARLGHMGHVLEAMLDMHCDPTALTRTFGCHIVQCEPDEVMREFAPLTADTPAVQTMSARILDFFDTPDPVSDPLTTKLTETDLITASRAAVALERFIEKKNLDGLAYYYEGAPQTEMQTLVTNFIIGNSLLTGAGFPMCGEFDIKTCIAMLIMDRLEIGGSFAEFHPVDFSRNTILIGHDGPHHLNIADRKPVIRSLKK